MPEQLKVGFYITLTLVCFLLYKKKKLRPTQLNLNGFKNRFKKKMVPGIRKVVAEVVKKAPEYHRSSIFTYQGEKYDALKVFNLPLGASLLEIKNAYVCKVKEDANHKSFYIKAYQHLIRK